MHILLAEVSKNSWV